MRRNFALSWNWIVIAILSAAIAVYFYKLFGLNTRFPGDVVDARFNQFILEHITRWLSGQEESLADPPFFYPFRNSYFFSDVHWGTALIYALPRLIGFDRETSYNIWFLTGHLSSFAAAWIILRRWHFEMRDAMIGAFIFAFSLPVLAQTMHPQLGYRFAIPFAIDAFLRMRRTRDLHDGLRFMIWTIIQLLLSLYHGLFLGLVIAILFILQRFNIVTTPAPAVQSASSPEKTHRNWLVVQTVTLFALVILLGMQLTGYVKVSLEYGFSRSWDAISEMLPRFGSFLIADRLDFYQAIGQSVTHIPERQEHQLFLGAATLLLLLLSFGVRSGNPEKQFLHKIMALTTGVIFVLTLNIAGYSLYIIMTTIAGFNVLRAVGRVYLVLLFPIAVLCAFTLAALRERRPLVANLLSLMTAFILFAEIATFKFDVVDRAYAQERIKALSSALDKRAAQDRPIGLLALTTKDDDLWAKTIDAMLVAQEKGIMSVSGYSGNFPLEYRMLWTCADAAAYLDRIETAFSQHPADARSDIRALDIIVVPLGLCRDHPASP